MHSEDKFMLGLALVTLVVTLGAVIIVFTGFHYETGNGKHSGYITAVQKHGVIFKTWRAYVKTDLSSSQEDIYCVETEEVAKKLEVMAENNWKGTSQYKSYIAAGVALCGGERDIIYDVNN